MAKAQGKKSQASSRRGARPGNDDAERLAALRWLVMKIEQVGIEIFVTDRHKFAAVEQELRAVVGRLHQIGRPTTPLNSDDCPGGYILCRDGLCAPMCDGVVASARKARR